jgi:hypothetical protein
MGDWATWVLDWGGKIGVGGVIGWAITRWVGSRDSAADRGRARVAESRPEVVPISGVWTGDHRVSISLMNRGPGTAQDVRVTFTGSAACALVPEILSDQRRETTMVNVADSPFFHSKLDEPAAITVQCLDRFGHEYVTVLPVNQSDSGNNHFGPLPGWGQHRTTGPHPPLTKKRLREIGGP